MSAPTVVGIYRAANAPHVDRLLAPVLAAGWTAAWWALDEIVPALAAQTVGEGPGEKLPLLQAAIERHGPLSAELVLSDDDIAFARGDLTHFVELARRAGLGLRAARPRARLGGESRDHPCPASVEGTVDDVRRERPPRRRRARVGRARDAAPRVAWDGLGIELEWIDLRPDGCRLGIVDATPITHLGKVSGGYDDRELRARVRAELTARGVDDWGPLQRTLSTWRPWRRDPPWAVE